MRTHYYCRYRENNTSIIIICSCCFLCCVSFIDTYVVCRVKLCIYSRPDTTTTPVSSASLPSSSTTALLHAGPSDPPSTAGMREANPCPGLSLTRSSVDVTWAACVTPDNEEEKKEEEGGGIPLRRPTPLKLGLFDPPPRSSSSSSSSASTISSRVRGGRGEETASSTVTDAARHCAREAYLKKRDSFFTRHACSAQCCGQHEIPSPNNDMMSILMLGNPTNAANKTQRMISRALFA